MSFVTDLQTRNSGLEIEFAATFDTAFISHIFLKEKKRITSSTNTESIWEKGVSKSTSKTFRNKLENGRWKSISPFGALNIFQPRKSENSLLRVNGTLPGVPCVPGVPANILSHKLETILQHKKLILENGEWISVQQKTDFHCSKHGKKKNYVQLKYFIRSSCFFLSRMRIE